MYVPIHGARLIRPDLTLFSLWAPDAESISIELGDGATYPMAPCDGGWHRREVPCGAGTGYRFIVDGQRRIPDPAARAQHDGINSFSKVVDHSSWQWSEHNWIGRPWHESVICEVHVGLLNGFKGVSSLLPHFKRFGITALELMPIGEFPGARNWGYDGVLPFAPHHTYGTPEDLKALIDAAHAHGIMIFIDVVYNHFGPDGNYLHDYASAFFRDDITTPWGAAIDFRRNEVRAFYIENALMWLIDYRADGLRFDAVHAISEQDFLIELADRIHSAITPERHVHLILENEHNSATLLESGFDAQWNDDIHNVLHTILTGEEDGYYADFATKTTEKLARCLGEGFIYQGETTHQGISRGQASGHLSPKSFIAFLQNHDQVGNRAFGERLITLTDTDRLVAATALLLLSPMIPMMFMGEEIGSRQPFFYFTDHSPELAQAVRAGRQKEFEKFLHFASSHQNIPDPNAPETFSASNPYVRGHNNSSSFWSELYSSLLILRHQYITPYLRNVRFGSSVVTGHCAVRSSWLLDETRVLVIDINIGRSETSYKDISGSETLFINRVNRATHVMEPGSVLVRIGG
ncbi:MAG: malto-oligosyltrehalose trehalohydrolase [Pseudohongiella sp.]|nr:malto-oligosyltrehalose trehalohydrolase [Pseudohongiella sp.]